MAQLQSEYAYVGTDMYIGEARPGSSPGSAKWRIKRIYNYTTSVIRERWADGNARFDKIWSRHGSYTYMEL